MTFIPSIEVKVRLLETGFGPSTLPEYQTDCSSGMDLRAHLEHSSSIAPGDRQLVPTGLAFEIPAGYEGQVRPRSGLAVKTGLTVLNSPGTIDSDYRGEVKVCLINLGREPVVINPGDRIAQLVFAPVVRAELVTGCLSDSSRGAGGFGHTGIS